MIAEQKLELLQSTKVTSEDQLNDLYPNCYIAYKELEDGIIQIVAYISAASVANSLGMDYLLRKEGLQYDGIAYTGAYPLTIGAMEAGFQMALGTVEELIVKENTWKPVIKAKINGVSYADVLIDTGSDYCVFYVSRNETYGESIEEYHERINSYGTYIKNPNTDEIYQAKIIGFDGTATPYKLFRLNSFNIGRFAVKNPVVALVEAESRYTLIIGSSLLKNFKLEYDYTQRPKRVRLTQKVPDSELRVDFRGIASDANLMIL